MNSVLLHIPHASRLLPDEWKSLYMLSDELLNRELVIMTDAYTDELFDLGGKADRLEFSVSRLLVDPERFPEDSDEPMAAKGMGAVYVKTHDGKPLKSDNQREELMKAYYYPHHGKLEAWVQRQLDTSGRCLIIDCHSYPSSPIACDRNQDPDRPDFCLGTAEPHTPPSLVEGAVAAFEDLGYSISVDEPYSGTIVPLKFFGTDPRVLSIMIEVNRRLYMDEVTGKKNVGFERTKAKLTTCLRQIVDYWQD